MVKGLLIDFDQTLVDFNASEKAAYKKTLDHYGLMYNDELYDKYHQMNIECWKEFEKSNDKSIFMKRWESTFTDQYLEIPTNINSIFDVFLFDICFPIKGVDKVLEKLVKKYELYVITNGSSAMQRNRLRLSGLESLFKAIFISEEIGYKKPDPEFFNYILEKIKLTPEEVMIIGDSISSDVMGAINSHIDYIYVNYDNRKVQGKSVKEFKDLLNYL